MLVSRYIKTSRQRKKSTGKPEKAEWPKQDLSLPIPHAGNGVLIFLLLSEISLSWIKYTTPPLFYQV